VYRLGRALRGDIGPIDEGQVNERMKWQLFLPPGPIGLCRKPPRACDCIVWTRSWLQTDGWRHSLGSHSSPWNRSVVPFKHLFWTHPVPGGIGNVAHYRRRPKASRCGDRLPGRASLMGAGPDPPPAHSFSRSWRRHCARRAKLDCRPAGIFPAGSSVVAAVPRLILASPGKGVHRRQSELLLRALSSA
jgi:hypothetical protein